MALVTSSAEIWTRTPSFPFHSLSLSLPTNFLLFGFILPNSRREVAVATRFGFGCSVSISRFIAFSVWFVICRSLVRLPLSPPHFSVWPQARWSQLLLVTFLFWQVEILVSSSDALVPSSFLLLLVRHLLLVAWHLLLVAQKSGHERRPFPFTRCPCPFQPTSCSSDSFSRTPEGKLQLLRGSVLDVQCPSRGSLHSLFGSLFVGLLCVCHFHLRIFQSGHKHVGVSFCL